MSNVSTDASAAHATRRATRDYRIDWLRGLALVTIMVNHMQGNRLGDFTLKNFGFSDSAELFVLLAGVSAAFAYFDRFAAGEGAAITARAWARAGKLYRAHLASTVAVLTLFAIAVWLTGDKTLALMIGADRIWQSPVGHVFGILTGSLQFAYFNILPMYVVFMLALPAYLWLARYDVRVMLAASAALYVVAQLFGLTLPSYPIDNIWFFDPLMWQVLFAIGLALGIARLRGWSVAYHPVAYKLALLWLAFAASWMIQGLDYRLTYGILPSWIDGLYKTPLPLPRLLHMLALAYVVVHSPLWSGLQRFASRDGLLTRLGRNGLPVFVVGSLVSMAGAIVIRINGGASLSLDITLAVIGFLIMWVTARIAEHGLADALASVGRYGALVTGIAYRPGTSAPIPCEA